MASKEDKFDFRLKFEIFLKLSLLIVTILFILTEYKKYIYQELTRTSFWD